MNTEAAQVDELPPFRQEIKTTLGRQFRWPFDDLQVIAFNAVLVIGGWFLLSPAAVFRFTSLIFLPAAIASWTFADVPATNLYGADPELTLQRIDDPVALRRLFSVRNVVLWILISPICFALAWGLAPSEGKWVLSAAIAVAVMCMPFAYLGLCSLVAPLLPFHRMPLKQRMHRRDTWLRWGVGVVIPYVLTTPAALLALSPFILVYNLLGQQQEHFLLAAVLMTPWCFLLWRVGLHLATRLTERRHDWLVAFLSDPSRG
ncbi:MAG: hypothetical protein WAU06_01260 [Candidatus Nanopelagicales bacterium]